MGMGIRHVLGNGAGREWELNIWECRGKGMLKAIHAHLYCKRAKYRLQWSSFLFVKFRPMLIIFV